MVDLVRRHGWSVVLGVGGVLVIAVAALRVRDAWVGDAAVYLPYSRNAADGHPFQFNVGEFSSGSTGVLWSLILAIPFVLGGGLAGAKVLGALFAVVGFLSTMWAARRLSGSWTAAAVASLFVLGTMPFYAVFAYESGLVVALSAAALVAGDRASERWRADGYASAASFIPLAAIWAALPLTRPDAIVLVIVQAATLLLLAPRARRRAALLPMAGALIVAALPSIAYFGYSLMELGTPSTSSQGRSFALQEFGGERLGPFFRSADAIKELVGDPWVFGLVPGLVGLTLVLRDRRHPARWAAVHGLVAIVGYVALLTFVTPGLFDSPRYLLPIVPILAAGIAFTIAGAQARLTPGWATTTALVAAGVLAYTGTDELRDQTGLARMLGITEQEVFERDVVDRLNDLARPGDALLAYEVQLRYFLRDDVSVLSQDGITDGKVAPYQADSDITTFMRRYRPAWWIADRNVDDRPYLRGTILQRARAAFLEDPKRRSVKIDGIGFRLVARRDRPLAAGFGGWELLLAVSY